jgi:hypothetical protein
MSTKQNAIRAGFGRKDITPELAVRLGGYGTEKRPAESINDRLNATSVFISQVEKNVIVVNLYWLAV